MTNPSTYGRYVSEMLSTHIASLHIPPSACRFDVRDSNHVPRRSATSPGVSVFVEEALSYDRLDREYVIFDDDDETADAVCRRIAVTLLRRHLRAEQIAMHSPDLLEPAWACHAHVATLAILRAAGLSSSSPADPPRLTARFDPTSLTRTREAHVNAVTEYIRPEHKTVRPGFRTSFVSLFDGAVDTFTTYEGDKPDGDFVHASATIKEGYETILCIRIPHVGIPASMVPSLIGQPLSDLVSDLILDTVPDLRIRDIRPVDELDPTKGTCIHLADLRSLLGPLPPQVDTSFLTAGSHILAGPDHVVLPFERGPFPVMD